MNVLTKPQTRIALRFLECQNFCGIEEVKVVCDLAGDGETISKYGSDSRRSKDGSIEVVDVGVGQPECTALGNWSSEVQTREEPGVASTLDRAFFEYPQWFEQHSFNLLRRLKEPALAIEHGHHV